MHKVFLGVSKSGAARDSAAGVQFARDEAAIGVWRQAATDRGVHCGDVDVCMAAARRGTDKQRVGEGGRREDGVRGGFGEAKRAGARVREFPSDAWR